MKKNITILMTISFIMSASAFAAPCKNLNRIHKASIRFVKKTYPSEYNLFILDKDKADEQKDEIQFTGSQDDKDIWSVNVHYGTKDTDGEAWCWNNLIVRTKSGSCKVKSVEVDPTNAGDCS